MNNNYDITDNLIKYNNFFKSSEEMSIKKEQYNQISIKIDFLFNNYNSYKIFLIEFIINKILNKNKINNKELSIIIKIINKISEINSKDLNIYSIIKLIINNIELYKLNEKQKETIIEFIKGNKNNLIQDYLRKYSELKKIPTNNKLQGHLFWLYWYYSIVLKKN
jgi:hypothetical protein